MTNILKDLTHKMQGQTHKKEVSWVLGIIYTVCIYNCIYIGFFEACVFDYQFGILPVQVFR